MPGMRKRKQGLLYKAFGFIRGVEENRLNSADFSKQINLRPGQEKYHKKSADNN